MNPNVIENIQISNLIYDDHNPRLPEYLLGESPPKLANHYFDHAVVSELAESMIVNGFFPHEPLIVKASEEDGKYVVVEGNRRLTALYLIHEVVDLPTQFKGLDETIKKRLESVPCVVSNDQEATRKYIGFRHISGPKPWAPAEKARFLTEEIELAKTEGSENPFAKVARAVGSNAQTVRGYYVALKLLKWAEEEGGVDVAQTQTSRFGVWYRLAGVPGFKSYINFTPESIDYDSIVKSVKSVDVDKLREVVEDLKDPDGGQAVLNDSRDATNYGKVLMSSQAIEVLRNTGDLSAAITIIEEALLADKILTISRKVDALTVQIQGTEYLEKTELAAKKLVIATKALYQLSLEVKDEDFLA